MHKRDLAMVRILLTAGADPDHSDNTGRTARDYAKAEGASGSGLLDAIAENDKHPRTKSAGGQTYGPTL